MAKVPNEGGEAVGGDRPRARAGAEAEAEAEAEAGGLDDGLDNGDNHKITSFLRVSRRVMGAGRGER